MSDPSAVDKMLRLSGLDGLFEHTSTICLFDPVKSLKLARVLEVIPRQLALGQRRCPDQGRHHDHGGTGSRPRLYPLAGTGPPHSGKP